MKKILPPLLFIVALVAMILLGWYWPIAVFLRAPWSYLGVIVILAGAGIGEAGEHQFRKARTPVEPFSQPVRMVRSGIYRYTRNPMYLGLAVILFGVWIMTGALSALLPPAVFILAIDRLCIRWEEAMLAQKFGQEFQEYKSRVRRWI